MASTKFTPGTKVIAKSSGRSGLVSTITPVKTGKAGRPKLIVGVMHDDGAAVEYSTGDLKVADS